MLISKNAVAIVVLFLGYFGVDVTDNSVMEFLGGLAQVISFAVLVYHQWVERHDTTSFFFKK